MGRTAVRGRRTAATAGGTGARLRGTSTGAAGPFPTFGSPLPDQLDGLRRTRSSGSSCVTSGSGSSSPAPKTRTVCAQASGAAPKTVCTSSCRTTRSVGSSPSAPGAGMPGQDQPSAAPQQGGGACARRSADPAVSMTTSKSPGELPGPSCGSPWRRTASTAPPGPDPGADHEQLGGGARLQELNGEHAERSRARPRRPARPGRAFALSAAAAMHAAGSSSAAAVRSASSGSTCSSRAGSGEGGRPSRRAG